LLRNIIAEFQPSIVTAAIPEVMTLLKDSDTDVRMACVTATLLQFSKQGKAVDLSCLPLLMKFIEEFQHSIGLAVLDMVKSLSDSDNNVRVAYADALSKLSQQRTLVS
jgi:HEAT repeat protein